MRPSAGQGGIPLGPILKLIGALLAGAAAGAGGAKTLQPDCQVCEVCPEVAPTPDPIPELE